MRYLVALAALLTAAPSTPIETGPGTRYFDGMPPARYDGTGAAIVVMVNDVATYCGEAPQGLTIIACTRRTEGGAPIIFMPNPSEAAAQGDFYARILAHELAHAQGWPGTHPTE
jgi:hypothetical protein